MGLLAGKPVANQCQKIGPQISLKINQGTGGF
jgi:hypothetical protein